jgi:DNA topoisomerase-1
MKCRAKVPIQEAAAVFTETGRPATRGVCPTCGTVIFRMGLTASHENIPKPEKRQRSGKLVIVESPAKARTVGRFLGKGYTVKASVGHVRDLLRSQLSVDVANDFQPQYRVPNEKKVVVKELKQEVKNVEEIYLATDPDREGEAIAWHLMQAAEIDGDRAHRVVFHEITPAAIAEAFSHSRALDQHLVDAQQARRILDRLVGYQISPLLWERVRNRTTAGRVQSVAVRLIVEREREILAFNPIEYWSIEAQLAKGAGKKLEARQPRAFVARLLRINGQEVNLANQPATQTVVDELQRSAYAVSRIKRGERTRRPSPPFTTSTLQQEGSRRLGFTAKRTMATAQALYEGVSISEGEGPIGLITYMRTDSLNIAEVAQEEARAFIGRTYGEAYLPKTPPKYKTKAKGAQEAHEAIRPTSANRTPEMLERHLTRDQHRLYQLIWNRFVASQMNPAIMDTISVDIGAGPTPPAAPYLFRVSGSSVRFPGFLAVYEEAQDEDAAPSEEESAINLPPLEENEPLDLVKLMPEQHFTQPPPRYTEATLVRTLEEYGIGRPSTYAPIISTVQARGYVERVDRRLKPTQLGMVVNDLLVKHFPDIVDVGFTASMEENLDRVASGEMEWIPMLRDFYGPFAQALKLAEATMEKVELDEGSTGEVCEKCGSPMVIKFGRFGKFIACSNYPQCRNAKPYLERVGARCPQCGGDLVKRRTRKGRFFYGCANYPTCNFSTWKEPLKLPCPTCGGLLVVANKDYAKCLRCENQLEMSQTEAEAMVEKDAGE